MDLKPPIVSLFQYGAAEEGNEIMLTAGKKKIRKQWVRVPFSPEGTEPPSALRRRSRVRSEAGFNSYQHNASETGCSPSPAACLESQRGLLF